MFNLKELLSAVGGQLIKGEDCEIVGVSTDSRTIKPKEVFFAIEGERFDGHNFIGEAILAGAAGVVISKYNSIMHDRITSTGKSAFVVKVKDTRYALGELAKSYLSSQDVTCVAITGSNGKTTTKEILYHLIKDSLPCVCSKQSYNNDIGVPLTIFSIRKKDKVVILELGTNKKGEIARLSSISQPNMAVILNVSISHTEGLGSIDGVAEEKAGILCGLQPSAKVFLNADSPYFEYFKKAVKPTCTIVTFSTDNKADYMTSSLYEDNQITRIRIWNKWESYTTEVKLLGKHNLYNIAAAVAIADHLGVNLQQAAEKLQNFLPPKGRLNIIKTKQGFTILDDTYNANPASMRAALDVLRNNYTSSRKFVVVGDMLELGKLSEVEHKNMAKYLYSFDYIFTYGKEAENIYCSLITNGKTNIWHFDDISKLICSLKDKLNSSDVVLIKGSRKLQMDRIVDALMEVL